MYMGNGSWIFSNTSGGLVTMTGTIYCEGSTISITDAGNSSKTFNGGTKIYNNFSITGGGTGAVILNGSNNFNTFTVNGPKTLTLSPGTVQTVANFVRSAGTDVITLNTGGAAAGLTYTGTSKLSLHDLVITAVNVLPANMWYYGNSTWNSGTEWNAGSPAKPHILLTTGLPLPLA